MPLQGFLIALPPINGSLEAGIAVGVDPNLPDDIKLPLLVGSNLQRAVSLAGAWARSKFSNMPPAALDLMTSGAMTCVMFGLLRKINGQSDGDWMPIQVPPAEAEGWDPVPASTYTVESLRNALTVIIATKANYWLTNHHTGQGSPSGYVLKVLTLKFPGADMASLTTAAHTLGHWASTLHCLNVAQIPGVRPVEPYEYATATGFELAPDALLRFTGLPAGTHRMGVAAEAASRIIKSALIAICPSPRDFIAIPGIIASIRANRAGRHVGAAYLTGLPRVRYNDTDADSYLGRLGTFINKMSPKSTLARSPHLAEDRVQSYPDFSSDFDNDLNSYKLQSAMAARSALQALDASAMTEEQVAALRADFRAGPARQ